jgi:hypothetical protein
MITPVPTHTPPLAQVPNLVGDIWSQWLNGLRQAVNASPGQTGVQTFATLPSAPIVGQIAVVVDSATNTWGATVTGGGALTVAVIWMGPHWTVIGK